MSGFCVVVADHAKADVYRLATARGPLERVASIVNPSGHGHERDLGTARPGRVTGGSGQRHALQPHQQLREHATEVYAQEVADQVGKLLAGQPDTPRVAIAAAPSLVGALRPKLVRTTRQQPLIVHHSLSKLSESQLAVRLRTWAGGLGPD